MGELMDISTLYPGTGGIFGNPSGMMNVERIQIQADLAMPGLGMNTSTKKSDVLKTMITEGLDGFLEENEVRGEDRVDPEIGTDMAQTAGVDGLGVTLVYRGMKWPIGLTGAFERMVDFQLELDVNDLAVGVALSLDDTDPSADSIKARFSVQTGLALYLGLNRRGAGIATEVPGTGLKFGFAVHQYMAYMDFNAVGSIDGFISQSEKESYFNLDGTPYTDDLKVNYVGYSKASAPGGAFGANWTFLKYFGIDFAASYNGTLKLGYISGEHYILNAIDQDESAGGGSEDAEFFDVGKLNLTKLTLTKKVTNEIYDVELQLPSRVGVSLHTSLSWLKLNFDYAWYYRGLSLTYKHRSQKAAFDTTYNDIVAAADGSDSLITENSTGRLGSQLQHKGAIGINLFGFFLNAGAYYGEPIFYENSREIDVKVMPILNLGYTFEIRDKYIFDVSLISLPLAILKTTVRYRI
ncbi:MAG: hypothetical protein HQK83_02310 [Fibrobacteria bacterium]|nr:hypothetical protein [Fibrobacteria bacterium]